MESYKAMFLINSILIASQKKARDKANGSWQSLIMKKKTEKIPIHVPTPLRCSVAVRWLQLNDYISQFYVGEKKKRHTEMFSHSKQTCHKNSSMYFQTDKKVIFHP